MDPNNEPPRWHLNSSFSPPPSTRYPFYPLTGSSNRVTEPVNNEPVSVNYGSSLGSRSGQFGSDRIHHHSVSDGSLLYFGSPASRWTPSFNRFDLAEFSTPSRGTRPETPYPGSTERILLPESSSLGSGSSPLYPPPHHHHRYPGRRSFMSKPVYPLVFGNPVSSEPGSVSHHAGPSEDSLSLPSPDIKFRIENLEPNSQFQTENLETNSRHGFRWSNASSYDFMNDAVSTESVDIQMDPLTGLGNPCPLRGQNQKCGLCERMLWQKSPYSSGRIMRNGDMPTCGVLPCRHVYHADCLEESTPKGEGHDPPCPLCTTRPGSDIGSGPVSVSEPLKSGESGKTFRNRFFKKQFSLRGRDFFGAGRVFKRVGSSSKNPRDDREKK